jgi:hypothetical protein
MAAPPDNHTKHAATQSRTQFYCLERPEPSPRYLELARAEPCRLYHPKKLLIVLDLNGTLIVRADDSNIPTPRPHVFQFLAYCLKHHCVAIWSSARRKNVEKMMTYLFTRNQISQLVAVWSREDSRLGEFFDRKIQVYKQLHWLWSNLEVQNSARRSQIPELPSTEQSALVTGAWDQINTVLVDGSLEKADSEPYNLVQVEEFTGNTGDARGDVLGAVLAYIEDLAWERDVSSAIRHKPFECARTQGWNWKTGCPDFDSDQERNSVACIAQEAAEREQNAKSFEAA